MATIRVSGAIDDVKQQLRRLSSLIKFRKQNGWTAFLDDEVWEYFTEQDDRVCPFCEGLGSRFEIGGWEVPLDIPDQKPLNDADPLRRHRYPNIHASQNLYPGLRGDCRCNMFWREPLLTLVNRLGREMEEVQ